MAHRLTCPICLGPLSAEDSFARNYPGMVCRVCDARALNEAGKPPEWQSSFDHGDNPVFIDGMRAWRRYRFGGYVTMLANPGAPDDDHAPDFGDTRRALVGCYERLHFLETVEGHRRIWPYVGPDFFAQDALRLMVVGVNAYYDPDEHSPRPWWFSKEFERARHKRPGVLRYNSRIADELAALARALGSMSSHSAMRSSGLNTAYVTNAIKVFLTRDAGLTAGDIPDETFQAYNATWQCELEELTVAPPHAIVVLGRRWWTWAWRTFADEARPRWATRFTHLPVGTELHHHLNIIDVSTGGQSYRMPLIEVDHPSRRRRTATMKWVTDHPHFIEAMTHGG